MKILGYSLISAILFCYLSFCAVKVAAQSQPSTEISGKITTITNEALPFASLMLFNATDSKLVKGAVTDGSGAFIIGNVIPGNYYISGSVLGYKTYKSEIFTLAPEEKKALGIIQLQTENKQLQTVTVTAQKPLIESKMDKVVMNVENSILATGNTAMDILQKAPGVTIDNGVISLIGKSNVMVLINDKQTYLSTEQLKDLLNSLQSNTIQSIELMTNPSAQYDAAGNAGIINIKIKKNDSFGTNADVNLSYGQGIYRKNNGGITINHRSKILNIFANYNYSDREDFSSIDVNRSVLSSGTSTFFQSSSLEKFRYKNHSFKVGGDINISPRSVLGFVVDGYLWHGDSRLAGTTMVGPQRGIVDSSIVALNTGSFPANYFNYDVNYKLRLDTIGTELTFSGDYSTSTRKEAFYFNNQFLDENQNEYRPDYNFRNLAPQKIDIYVGKADFRHPFSKSSRLDAGFKYSAITIDNVLKYDILQNDGSYLNDERRSNQFIYDEKIGAAYANYNTQIGSYSIQAGLRVERTSSRGNLVTGGSIVEKSYTDLFPTLFLQKKIDNSNAITASYGRRVGRPDYASLNPFVYYVDQYTLRYGNPFLKPQYTNSYKIGYRFKNKYTVDLSYSRTKDGIAVIFVPDTKTKTIAQTDANLNSINSYSLNINAPVTFTNWWRSYNNVTLFYNQYNSDVIEGAQLQLEKLAWQASSNHTFTIDNKTSAELSGKYVSPNVYGVFNIKSYYGIDLGLRRAFLSNKMSVKLAVNDVFKTIGKRTSFSNLPNNSYTFDRNYDSRVVRLSISYKFGNIKLKSTDKNGGSAEEEKSRLNKL